MISVPEFETVSSIGTYLRDSGFDVSHLSDELHLTDGLYANRDNLESLLAKTDGDSVVAILARLFFVCWPVEEARCRAVLSERFLSNAAECGLLVVDPDGIAATACIFPFRSHLIACESSRNRSAQTDIVTGPSASTQYPARLAIGGSNETTLDLGTGTGILALEAKRYSRRVVGTDINPRCLQFAAFNAALNGISNIDWRCGDTFVPVAGERFTRIVANPPFFLSPAHTYVYCDSPLELDGFTANLARECTNYLEEGGYYQMICEWVEVEGQSWEERLQEWTAQSNCDVLVLVGPKLTPLEYADRRTREAALMQAGPLEHSFSSRFRYLKDRKVNRVLGGVVTMRKRSGRANWFTATEVDPVGRDIGYDVRNRFDALTFLATSDERGLLATRIRLSSELVLNKTFAAGAGEWQTKTIDLVKPIGLVDKLRLDETVSQFVPLFDGTKSLSEIAVLVSERLQVSADEAQTRCLQLAKRLIQSNIAIVQE